jgi:cytochrome c oxidase subunit 3
MPGTNVLDDLELIVEDIGGGGGGPRPPAGGDPGGGGNRNWPSGRPSSRRYATAIALAMVSIFMFFMAMVSAFIVLRETSQRWIPLHLPSILFLNTLILLASSLTMEISRKKLAASVHEFRVWWGITTGLGLLFVAGQLVAWRELVHEGIYVASTLASGFFYIFTALHGLHLLGGICALLYVAVRNFDSARRVSRRTAADVTSYYWHFMDGLWVFLFALLYFGK